MGMYTKYTPIRVNFDLAPNLTPSNKKLGLSDKGSSSLPSSLPRKGIYAQYTPFRVNFDLAPNLTPSNKKLGLSDKGYPLP